MVPNPSRLINRWADRGGLVSRALAGLEEACERCCGAQYDEKGDLR